MLQSQPGLGSTVMHVHTYDGRAQIAVKNLVSLLRDWISTVFRVSVLNRTNIYFVSQTIVLLRGL